MKKWLNRLLAITLAVIIAVPSMLLTVVAEALNPMEISVATVEAIPGQTMDVTISLENNPGVAVIIMALSYDQTLLTLNSITYNTAMGGSGQNPGSYNSPVNLTWYNTANYAGNGVFVTLNFTVSKEAEVGDVAVVALNSTAGDVSDVYETPVAYKLNNGAVSVVEPKAGDINADHTVDGRDLLRLAKYHASWDVKVNEYTVDVNGDGFKDGRDLLRLAKYFAGWDVEIYANGIPTRRCPHSMTAIHAKEPTCTEEGNDAYWQCTLCEKYYGDAAGVNEVQLEDMLVVALDHDRVAFDAVPATPTTEGYTAGVWCNRCETWVEGHEVISPTG